MNLTKRMLQFTTVCAGVCALSASATQYVGDSFENNGSDDFPATNGMGIVYYKATNNGFGTPSVTNWVTAEGDASAIIDADADNQAYASATRPMSGVVSNLLLNLSTEGQTLSRTVDGGPVTFTTTPVWVDTLIKFTASEDAPSSSDLTDAKAAVYVDANSNLVVYHGVDGEDPTNTVIGAISTNDWHRLTIYLGGHPGTMGHAAFKVLVDGTVVTSDKAYTEEGAEPEAGGTWFYSAATDTTISSVAFKGTGKVDELVVTDEEVTFAPPNTGVLLTLAFDSALVDVTQGGTPVANGGTVASGTEIVIDAADWYQIQSVSGTGDAAYSGLPVPGGDMVNVSTGTVSATASETLTITVTNYTGSVSVSGVNIDAGKMSAWALTNNKTEAQVWANGESWYDDYLCNVAPETNPTLTISAIAISGTTATITVTASAGVELDSTASGGINGTLVVYTKATLGDSWGEPSEEFSVTAASGTTAMIDVDMAGNNFIKAVIR